MLRSKLGAIASSSLAIMAALSEARAQEFYQGKNITIVIANTAGSGYDAYGRLISRYMAKYLPGKPNVIAQNMPGAGAVRATEYINSIAPKDGTHFALVIPSALVEPLTKPDPTAFRYDATKLEYIGTADSGTRVCLSSPKSGFKSFEEAQQRQMVVAATQPGTYAYLLLRLAKAKFKIVTGYPGPNDVFLAVERGEADGICAFDTNAVNSVRPGLIGSDKINVLIQIGLEPNPALTALGVPSIWKYVEPQDRALVELIVSEQVFQRPFIAPPGTPAARLKELRAAFDAAVKDPELLAEAKKGHLEINPKSGEEVAALVKKMYAAPKELVERIGKVTRP